MEEKPFRVLLDLSDMNIGENEIKYVWMCVSPRELKTIFDFKRAINKKIPHLQENYKLFLRDGLLLENEKISILREDDTIKLQLESSQSSFQECTFRSLDMININAYSDKPLICDTVISKASKKRKSDGSVNLTKESNSIHKEKKKKPNKSPHKLTLDNEEDTTYVTLNSMPNLSYAVSEPPKEKSKKNLSSKKKMDGITNMDQSVGCYSKSKTIRNDNVPHSFTDSQEENVIYESDLNFINTSAAEEVIVENEFSQRYEQDLHSEAFASNNLPQSFIQSLEIENSADIGKFKSKSQIVRFEDVPLQTKLNLEGHTSEKNEPKKKKRRRKRKQKNSTVLSESNVLESDINMFEPNVVSTETYNTSDKRRHIIYESPISSPRKIETLTLDSNSIDCSEIQDSSQSMSKEGVGSEFLSGLDKCIARFVEENKLEETVSGNLHNTLSRKADGSLRVSTPYPRKKLQGHSWDITPLSGNSRTPSNTFIIEDCNVSKEETAVKSYAEFPSINYLPPVGTRLAFKTLELNKNYCPEVTDYKEGIIKNVDLNTDELTIDLAQEEVKTGRIGKFENLEEDEIPPNEIVKTVFLNWSALIDPRLIT